MLLRTLIVLLSAQVLSASAVLHAATVVVDTTSDNIALQACTSAPGDCSLRGGLVKTQRDLPGEDTIHFDIPASDANCNAAGVCTITLTSGIDLRGGVPGIQTGPSQGFTIDGYTQPGASVNTLPLGQGSNAQPKIKLRPPAPSPFVPEILTATPFTIRGLIFENVFLTHDRGDGGAPGGPHPSLQRYEVMGNFFGYDADGVTPLPAPNIAGTAYIRSESLLRGLHVGSGLPADINLFGGADPRPNHCLFVHGGGHRVRGNFIGVDRSGVAGSGCSNGIKVQQENVNPQSIDVGGVLPGEGNVIGGNVRNAIEIGPGARDRLVRIRGNFIGVGVDGVTPVPNLNLGSNDCAPFAAIRSGFPVPGSAQIGGLLPGEGNLFGPNGINRGRCPAPLAAPAPYMQTPAVGEGMGVWQVQGNRYLGLEGMAVDARQDNDANNSQAQRLVNDAGDADTLAVVAPFLNRLQNFPTISAFSLAGNQVDLTYKVDSAPANSLYPLSIEFLRDDGSGNLTPIGSDTYTEAQAQTDKAISFALPAGVSLSASDIVIATATTTPNGAPGENVSGETSESTFYPLESFSLVSITPTTTPSGVPVTVRVRAVAAPGVPFKPNGRVLVQGRPGIPEECIAQLEPVAAARTSEGECQLLSTAPPGTLGVRVSYDGARNSFALADGRHPASAVQDLTVTAGITALELVSGNNQTAAVGDAFAQALVVRAVGTGGTPIAGVPVQFSGPPSGAGASFAPATPVSGADGLASTTATAIRAGGSYTVTARVGTITQTFTLTNEPGLDTALEIVSHLPNPSVPGQAVTVTIALNPEAGGPAPSGSIAVSANTGEACAIALPASSCVLTFASVGERAIQAFYPGDANYLSSKAAFAAHPVIPVPTLRIDDVSQDEGNSGSTSFTFTVTLDHPTGGAVSVDFASADDSASAPGDYSATSGTLNFSGSSVSQSITVVVTGDEEFEADEHFLVNLTGASGAAIGDSQGIGTIVNDDTPQPPRVRIDDATAQEPLSSGLTTALVRFRLHLNRPADGPVSVRARSVDGSANGNDYGGVDQRIEFAPGQRERILETYVRDDLFAEPPESFTIELSEAQGIAIADGSATGTILDGSSGAALVVTSSADPGDGVCNAAECTLREAINTGNTLQSVAIEFAIPGAGPHTIRPLTPLPIPGPAIHTIDGYSQQGSRLNSVAAPTARLDADLRIALDGSALGPFTTGLTSLHGLTIRGLAIHGWRHAAIMAIANSARPTRIVGNYLGTGVDGLIARGNGLGIDLRSDGIGADAAVDLLVGGDGPDRNLISGNSGEGVVLLSGNVPATRVRIADNLIGLGADGSALGNGGHGISLGRPNVLVEGNVLAGNGGSGIVLAAPARILRNFIGTDAEQRALGNGEFGVSIGGAVTTVTGGEVRGNEFGTHPQGGVRIVRVIGGGQQSRVPVVPLAIATATTPIEFGSGAGGPNEDLPAPQIIQQGFNDRGDRLRVTYQIPAAPVAGRPLSAHFYVVEDGSVRLLGVHGYSGGSQTSELALDRPLRAGARLRALSERAGTPPVSSVLGPEGPVLPVRKALVGAQARRENQGNITFIIRLDSAPTAPVMLDYRTVDGSALAGAHYLARSGTLSLGPGQPVATLEVPLIDNVLVDGNREFKLEVYSVADFSIGTSTGLGSILDDDLLRPDHNPADTLALDELDGVRGFRIEHVRDPEASLADLGDFDGNGARDLMLARSGGAAISDNPGSLQLLMNLPTTVPALVQLPPAGTDEFPLIVDDAAQGAAFRALGLPNLRGAGTRGSIVLRRGNDALVLHGRSTPLPATADLSALAVATDAQLLAIGSPLQRVVDLGDINGDGRADFGVLAGGAARVYFGQPVGTPLPTTFTGNDGFLIRGNISGPAAAVIDVVAIGRGDPGGFQASLLVRVQLGPATCLFRQIVRPALGQPWPGTVFANEFPVLEGGNSPRAAYCGPVEMVSGRLTGVSSHALVLAYPEFVGARADGALQIWSGSPGSLSLVGRILPVFPGDRLGQGLALLPDFDGDGRNDLAFGVAGADAPETGAGQVVIARGVATSSFGDIDLTAPPTDRVRFLSALEGGRAGWRLAAIGDLNGDGRGELGISAPRLGRSYVVYSDDTIHRASSEARSPPRPLGSVLEVVDGGNQIDLLPSPLVPGFEILASGDVDGNGRDDLLIGDPGGAYALGAIVSVGGEALSSSGLALSFLPSGPGYTRWAYTNFNFSLDSNYAVGGDFDGDGFDDLAFHDRNERLAVVHGRNRLLGGFRNPFLGRSGAPNAPDDPRTRWIQLGGVLRLAWLGDVDGDGFDDLGLLRSGAGGRTVEIVYGNAGGPPRRTTVSAPAELQPIRLSREPGLGRIRGGALVADSFEIALGDGSRAVVFGGALPGALDLGALGGSGVILRADHWRRMEDALVVGLGDLDGDGLAEIGVAHTPPSPDGAPQGRVELLRGRSGYPTHIDMASTDPALIQGRILLRGVGASRISALDSLGDRNADGRRELLIVLPEAEGHAERSGVALLMYGFALPSGVQTERSIGSLLPPGAGLTVRNARFSGQRMVYGSVLGDLDGDGLDEIGFSDNPEQPQAPGVAAYFILRGSALDL